MASKTILVVDDEQGYVEPLRDALEFGGYRVLTARSAEEALRVAAEMRIDLATVDIMMPPGESLESSVASHEAGLYVCKELRRKYPSLDLFCISVVTDERVIREVKALGIRFLRKGETPLRTVLEMLESRLTGVAYSTVKPNKWGRTKP